MQNNFADIFDRSQPSILFFEGHSQLNAPVRMPISHTDIPQDPPEWDPVIPTLYEALLVPDQNLSIEGDVAIPVMSSDSTFDVPNDKVERPIRLETEDEQFAIQPELSAAVLPTLQVEATKSRASPSLRNPQSPGSFVHSAQLRQDTASTWSCDKPACNGRTFRIRSAWK
jgi:hypothetical protein